MGSDIYRQQVTTFSTLAGVGIDGTDSLVILCRSSAWWSVFKPEPNPKPPKWTTTKEKIITRRGSWENSVSRCAPLAPERKARRTCVSIWWLQWSKGARRRANFSHYWECFSHELHECTYKISLLSLVKLEYNINLLQYLVRFSWVRTAASLLDTSSHQWLRSAHTKRGTVSMYREYIFCIDPLVGSRRGIHTFILVCQVIVFQQLFNVQYCILWQLLHLQHKSQLGWPTGRIENELNDGAKVWAQPRAQHWTRSVPHQWIHHTGARIKISAY
jgi:hypothetical protein